MDHASLSNYIADDVCRGGIQFPWRLVAVRPKRRIIDLAGPLIYIASDVCRGGIENARRYRPCDNYILRILVTLCVTDAIKGSRVLTRTYATLFTRRRR
jgi:hypothetical protein